MDWNQPVDLYCERLHPGLWAEPLNALTNAAFLVAAWMLWRRLRGASGVADLRVLAVLIALVGLGSLVFHTVATVGTSQLDIAFIVLFMLMYVHRWLVRVGGAPPSLAWLGVGAFMLLDVALRRALADLPLNGSQLYAAAFCVLAGMGWYGAHRRVPGNALLLAAFAVFLVSVSLRSVDLAWCPLWPSGTHFLWHLCNAVVLYLCVMALWRAGRRIAVVSAS